MTIDPAPAAQRMADLVTAVPDEALEAPTPCPDYTVAGLLDHVHGFARAFTTAARKDFDALRERPGPGQGERLAPGWRTEIPAALIGMAAAWGEPGAQEGITRAGGADMPAEVVASVAVEEMVVHGWDLARSVGLEFDPPVSDLSVAATLFEQVNGPNEVFGAPIAVEGGSDLDRVIGLSGRDPGWSRPASRAERAQPL